MITKSLNDYPELLTVPELAEYLRCSTKTAYEFLRCGAVKSKKIGLCYRISKADVIDYLQSH